MSTTSLLPLPSQEFFESLIVRPSNIESTVPQKANPLVIVYFTARWCGACKRLDIPTLMGIRADAIWYKCDVDENPYTPGYCGISTIPAFQAISHGRPLPLFSNSDTIRVAEWLARLPK
jgi:thioredoxin-like negative regulator of GroEL